MQLPGPSLWNVKSDVFRKNETEENMAYASIILRIVPPAVVLGTRTTWNERYVPSAIIAHGLHWRWFSASRGHMKLARKGDWPSRLLVKQKAMPCEPKTDAPCISLDDSLSANCEVCLHVCFCRELEWLFSIPAERSQVPLSRIFFISERIITSKVRWNDFRAWVDTIACCLVQRYAGMWRPEASRATIDGMSCQDQELQEWWFYAWMLSGALIP